MAKHTDAELLALLRKGWGVYLPHQSGVTLLAPPELAACPIAVADDRAVRLLQRHRAAVEDQADG